MTRKKGVRNTPVVHFSVCGADDFFFSWRVGFFKTPSAWPSSDLSNFLATFLMRNECDLGCSSGCFDIQHRLILPNSQIDLDLRNQPCNGNRSFPGSHSPKGWPHETWKF